MSLQSPPPRWWVDLGHLTSCALEVNYTESAFDSLKAWKLLILSLWKLSNTWEIWDHCDVQKPRQPHRKAHMAYTPTCGQQPQVSSQPRSDHLRSSSSFSTAEAMRCWRLSCDWRNGRPHVIAMFLMNSALPSSLSQEHPNEWNRAHHRKHLKPLRL